MWYWSSHQILLKSHKSWALFELSNNVINFKLSSGPCYLTAAVQGLLPQLHLQLAGCCVEEAADGCGFQFLLRRLLQLISTHLQVPAAVKSGSSLVTPLTYMALESCCCALLELKDSVVPESVLTTWDFVRGGDSNLPHVWSYNHLSSTLLPVPAHRHCHWTTVCHKVIAVLFTRLFSFSINLRSWWMWLFSCEPCII